MKVILSALLLCAFLNTNVSAAGSCDGYSGTPKMTCCQNHPRWSGCN